MTENTQDEPTMDQHAATDETKADGIVDQTRADLAGRDAEAVEHVLRQRFAQAGIDLPGDDIARRARQIAQGG